MNQKHDRSAQHAPSAIDYCRTLNLFRHKLMPDLYCVVPEDCPVPVFVAGDDWRFVTDAGEATRAAIETDAAATPSLRRTGYYLFRSHAVLKQPQDARSGETVAIPALFPTVPPTDNEIEFFVDCFA